MSKSFKLPIIKDKTDHKFFRRTVRRIVNQKIKDIKNLVDLDSYEIPNTKTIVNDYDYCDYILDLRLCIWKNIFDIEKAKRK